MSGFTFPFSVEQVGWSPGPSEDDPAIPGPDKKVLTINLIVNVNVNVLTPELGSVYTDTIVLKGYLYPCPGGGMRLEFEEVD